MFKNYFITAIRNLRRNRVFSIINISGLSIGLACCLLVLLYTKDELSFDRFHANGKNLYRITCEIIDKKHGRDEKYGISAMVQGPAFKAAIPEVKTYVRTMDDELILRSGRETFHQKVLWADDNFFTVFSFPLLYGNPSGALADPHAIVLTDEMAKKYFGSTDAIGKTIELEIDRKFETFTVSAIARRSPENSSIGFDMLLPFKYYEKIEPDNGWLFLSYSTFLQMQPGASMPAVVKKMRQVYEMQSANQREKAAQRGFESTFLWGLQPFIEMHLDDSYHDNGIRATSKPVYSYILNGIAFFILLIASINFINLTVAQSIRRSKEIGLRKVVGSSRAQLIRQFLGESFILCFIAFAVAFMLAYLLLPLFNQLANKQLSLSYLLDLPLIMTFAGLFLFTGFAAGFYPSLVLSGFNPVETLYQRIRLNTKNYLSKSLVVLQFALATFLIISTFFLYSQYSYLTHMDLGFNDKDLLAVNVSGMNGDVRFNRTMQTEFLKIPGVSAVGRRFSGGRGTLSKAAGKDIMIDWVNIDDQFFPAMQIPVKAGRNFSPDFLSDSTRSVIVNEAYVKAAGWKDPIGKTVDYINGQDTSLTVVGVIKDYHYASLKEEVRPQLFTASLSQPTGRFMIRIDRQKRADALRTIEATYRQLYPWHPFEHYFVDDQNKKAYESEARWSQIITCAAVVTIFISCIGLFGLSLLSIRQRTKEIGVRKVLGATIWQIAGLVSRNFVALVLIAFLLAIPAAWYAVSRWLQNFPYRIDLNAWVFLAAIGLTLLIAVLTVGAQALKAGRVNPANSLRTE